MESRFFDYYFCQPLFSSHSDLSARHSLIILSIYVVRQRNGKGKPTSSCTVAKKLVDNVTKREREKSALQWGGRPSQPRLRTPSVDLELASVKRGTISCPNASEKKSTQGTRANIFSTQIGYSNYPRLFNLATRLQALFQVPSTVGEIGEFGLVGDAAGGRVGNLSHRYIILCMTGGKKTAASACRTDDSDRDSVLFKG